MLAAVRFDEPVDGIVRVLGGRLHALVTEVDGLLSVVADVGDVAHLVLQGTGGGYVVPPANSEKLSDAIVRALDQTWNPNQLSELIQSYTWEGTSQKISAEITRYLALQESRQKGTRKKEEYGEN